MRVSNSARGLGRIREPGKTEPQVVAPGLTILNKPGPETQDTARTRTRTKSYTLAYVRLQRRDKKDTMNWTLTKIATSLMGLLGQPEKKVSDSTLDNRCEDIREAMLAILDQCGTDATTNAVSNRVCYARNVESLWYLRGAIMAQLTIAVGEPKAREELARITEMFKGYLPAGLGPRSRARAKAARK